MGKGITNNAVEFLVTLGIDEAKSKKSIDSYLTRISNTQLKLTFSVNVGVSNANIKTFIDKHQGKAIKVDFDVNKTVSNKNLKTYVDTKKNVSGNIVFDVDIKKTNTNIKKSIALIKVQSLLVNLDVAKLQSTKNIKKFLTDLKLGKKLVELDVSKNISRSNINSYLSSMKLSKVGVAIGLAQGGLNDLKESAKKSNITGLKGVLQLDVAKTKEAIAKQIDTMKLPKFKVDVVANVIPNVKKSASQNIAPTQQKESSSKTGDFVGTKPEVIEKIKNQYKEAGKEAIIFEDSMIKGQKAFIARLESEGKKLNIIRDAQTKEITKITATSRNSANEIISTVYKPLIATYDNVGKKVKDGSKEVRGFVAQVDKIDNKKMFDMQHAVDKISTKFEQAKHKGHVLGKEVHNIEQALKQAGNNNDISKINKQLDNYIRDNKNAIELERARNNVLKQREQILAQVTRTEKLYMRSHDKSQAQDIKNSVKMYSQDDIYGNAKTGAKGMDINAIREYSNQLAIAGTQARNLNAQATEATKNSMGIINSLKVAMEKFPIWMIASTAFYGSIRTLRTFGEIIIDVDTKMTDLKKVMSEDTDFDKIFERATTSAETFGQTISNTMDAYIQFAKQGFKGDQLEELSNAGLVAGNVGDIETGKASEYLTASLLQWKKDTSEAMGMVDSWNELSNNYATTVENLAQGQAKAGATARAMGLDFNQLNSIVGVLNANTKQSGNEIGNFVKAVMPRLVNQPGQKALATVGVSLTDEAGNMRDVIQVYKDVATEMKKLSETEQLAVVKGLAGTYHISRMQILLDTLGETDSMYDQMYESASNSANSAMTENAVYMESLQARINLAKVEIEKLALAIGEAFMTESMIQLLSLFGNLVSLLTNVTKTFGVLTPMILAGGVALTLLSRRFKDVLEFVGLWVTSLKKSKIATDQATASNSRLNRENLNSSAQIRANSQSLDNNTRQTRANNSATQNLAKSKKALMLGMGALGIAGLAVGFGIELLTRKMSEARKEQEAFAKQQKEDIAGYQTHGKEIDELAERYSDLSNQELSPDTKEYSELLEVQNSLSELLPSLKTGEDAYGNAIIQNSKIVSGRIDLLKEQIRIEKELADVKASQEQEETEKEAKKTIKKENKKIDGGLADARISISSEYESLAKDLGIDPKQDIQSLEQLLEVINKVQAKLNDKNFTDKTKKGFLGDLELSTLKGFRNSLVDSFNKVNTATLEAQSNLNTLKVISEDTLNGILQSTEGMSDGAVESFSNLSSSAMAFAKDAESLGNLSDSFSGISVNDDMKKSFEEFSTLTKQVADSTIADLDDMKEKFNKSFADIKKAMLMSSGLNKGSEEYKAFAKAIDDAINAQYEFEIEVSRVAKETGQTEEETRKFLLTVEDSNAVLEEGTSILGEYADVAELLSGVTSDSMEEISNLVAVYEALSNRLNLTSAETLLLEQATNALKKLYPEMNNLEGIRIETIRKEQKTIADLQEAYGYLTEGKLTSEETMTVSATQQTIARIALLRKEIQALQVVLDTRDELSRKINKQLEQARASGDRASIDMSGLNSGHSFAGFEGLIIDSKKTELGGYISDIDRISSSIGGVISNVKAREQAEKDSAKASKDSAKEQSATQKITDKYALSLEKVNTQLKQIQANQSQLAKHSERYRKSIQQENALIEQQIKLNNQKINDLKVVSKTATTTSSTTTATSKAGSGSNYASGSGLDSQIWNFFKNKGLTDSATAGIMGNLQQESGLSTTAVNKTSGATGIAQWLGGRLTNLKNYASSVGTAYTNLNTQLEWLWKELNGADSTTKSILTKRYGGISGLNNMNASQVAKAFEDSFERSGGSAVAKRQTYANNFLNKFSGTSGGSASTTSYSTSTSTSVDQDERNNAISEIESLTQNNIDLKNQVIENNKRIIDSTIEEFEYSRQIQESIISKEQSKSEMMSNYTDEYIASLNKQNTAEKRKLDFYKKEDTYIQSLLKSGKLSELQTVELLARQRELSIEIQNSTNSIIQYNDAVANSKIAKYQYDIDDYQNSLDYKTASLQRLDKQSKEYINTQKSINIQRAKQVKTMEKELAYARNLITTGNISASMYDELTTKVGTLTQGIINLNAEMQNANYEMIQNVASRYDNQIDDIDFLLDRSSSIMSMYDEDSGDHIREQNFQLEKQYEKLLLLEEKRLKVIEEISNADLSPENREQLEEQLEDIDLAYWSVKSAVVATAKAMDEQGKSLGNNLKDKLDELADDVIDAYKDYVDEARDIKLEAIEEEIKLEEERHEKVMKQYDDELDAYSKIIESKRKELSNADRDRSFNNTIQELTDEKSRVENRLSVIANDNSLEGIKEKSELQKELKQIEKDIAEEYYQRELELREEQLDTMLTDKEESIEKLQEAEEKHSDGVLEELDKKKEYWELYFRDMLNDEEEFARLRALVHERNYNEIESMFNGKISELVASLPELENTFDGTWQAVGTQIRENVISALQEALEGISDVEAELKKLTDNSQSFTGSKGNSYDEITSPELMPDSKEKLTGANMKMILSKFLGEEMVDKMPTDYRKEQVTNRAKSLSTQAQSEGATVQTFDSLASVFDGFTNDDFQKLGDYFASNIGMPEFQTKDYADYIKNYASSYKDGNTILEGDMHVLLGKYMKEHLTKNADTNWKKYLADTATKKIATGKSKGSIMPDSLKFNDAIQGFSGSQLQSLGDYFEKNASSSVQNTALQNELKAYAQRLKQASGLDVGGMTKAFGSIGGVDGKGGKFSVLHENEIVSNPIDSSNMIKASSIMERVMNSIKSAISFPTSPKLPVNNNSSQENSGTTINVNIAKMTGNENDINRLSQAISDKLLREKGKR